MMPASGTALMPLRGASAGTTSPVPKVPVVKRLPPQFFYEAMPLATSVAAVYSLATGAGTVVAGVAVEEGAATRWLSAPNPVTVGLMALFYSPGLNAGGPQAEMDKRTLNQLYLENIPGKITVGAYIRRTSDVTRNNYIPEFELQEIAKQNGRARTRVRFRFENDPETGEIISRSYEVNEKSGLDRVRVRFAQQLDGDHWSFEEPLSKTTLIWSRSRGEGEFEKSSNRTTVHEGGTGGYTTPPTPIPEARGLWGLENPVPEPLPPLQGTPVPEPKKPDIEYFPIEEQIFNDYIIVDPMGAVPAIYVYFKKEKVPAVEFEIDYYGKLREKYFNVDKDGNAVEFDHLPSQAACTKKLLRDDPLFDKRDIKHRMDYVAAIIIKKITHQQDSETYGGRQHTKVVNIYGDIMKRSERDSQDLRFAVDSNWNAL
ncbi:S-type pyocin domain-containing protein [Leclercia adecarboxylata]|jgi:hypothetical protein|uniref:S-type pyocin domain-containing protein n=1 Tax=Leclercia adecarboxylata TaxID=83655 RepID=UPI0037097F6E